MNKQEAQKLIDRYNEHTASPEERAWVEHWYLNEASGRSLSDAQDFEHLNDEIWMGTLQRAGISKRRKLSKIWPILSAAVLFLTIGICIYFYNTQNKPVKRQGKQYVQDVNPGGNKAILTLANGEKVVLTDANTLKIAEQAGISITKTADGQLIYTMDKSKGQITDGKLVYNTIETPKGGQYQINLPDGTKVWLNAASSLKYPVQFAAKERRVELKGEGYFEVSSDKERPFKVIANKQETEVLGTHFNINAYADEHSIKTTLLEGKVKVSQHNQSVILKPGQQSTLKQDKFDVGTADLDLAVAWKNGYFMFKNASLQALLLELSRWYDVEVKYEGDIPATLFTGKVHRNTTLAQALELLSFSEINFKIEGKKISIIPHP
ncbi:FecR family protein [Pedobacter nyackensis]|uniref:FecR family protein n=1 Tax=Pedobacter nyackensis TaxID=475255 RepID=UPI00293112C4|nr:FecR family protein [Pedobacter nyackensis]